MYEDVLALSRYPFIVPLLDERKMREKSSRADFFVK